MSEVQAVLAAGRGVILSPSRLWARHFLHQLKRPRIDPYDQLSGPFEPVRWARFRTLPIPDGAVLDLSRALPWDDPIWRALLPQWTHTIRLLPERYASNPADARPVGAEAAPGPALAPLEPAQLAPGPADAEDGPALRRWVLLARSSGEDLPARLLRLGQHELQYGRSDRAYAAFTEGAAAALDPHTRTALLEAAGDAASICDRIADARSYYERAGEEAKRIPVDRPNRAWGEQISRARVAQSQRAFGRFEQALLQIREAHHWTLAHPESDRQITLARQRVPLEVLSGHLDGALAVCETAIATARGLLAREPRRFDGRADLLGLLIQRTEIQLALGDLEGAYHTLGECPAIAAALLSRAPGRAHILALVADAATTWSDAHLSNGRPAQAQEALRRAMAIYQTLSQRDPERRHYRLSVARSQRRMLYTGRHCTDAGFSWTKQHYEARPSDPLRTHDLALALMARAWVQESHGEPALSTWQEALKLAANAYSKASHLPALERTHRRCQDALTRLQAAVTNQ